MVYLRAILAQCGRKTRYPTEAAALAGIALRAATGVLGLRAYQCRYCLAWHMGKAKHWWWPRPTAEAPLIVSGSPPVRRDSPS